MLILKLVIEILILWVWFALFMLALVGRKVPAGGIIFYPKVMQDRVIEMGLTTAKKIKQRTVISMTLLLIGDLIFPIVMILFINGARGFSNVRGSITSCSTEWNFSTGSSLTTFG